ncbi:M15 family metallopeptidase [Promicromonospora sp. NPDC060204]|uniref:M15 family metallopeptidase n=1 Tax=Promicromonospora sp. NPDC060204 TaxID=3347071 RepID=UPI0036690F21
MTRAKGFRAVPLAAALFLAALLAAPMLLAGCADGSGAGPARPSDGVGLSGSGQQGGGHGAGEPGTGGADADGATGADGATDADGGAGAASAVGQQSAPAAAEPGDDPGIDLTARSITDPASPWVVVNKHTPLDPVDYEPDLTTVRGYLVRPDVAPDLTALLAAADADGVRLTLRSAYRGYPKQAAVYEGWVAQLGAAQADAVSARPGHSEHQTGLAVDVGGTTEPGCDFEPCFGQTAEGRWVAEHAGMFGFLVRYTPENSDVTGYAPEAWHLRWVGRDLAAYLADTDVTTLEEVFDVPGGGYTD